MSVCLCANMVLTYKEASHRSREGLKLLGERILYPPKTGKNPTFSFKDK